MADWLFTIARIFILGVALLCSVCVVVLIALIWAPDPNHDLDPPDERLT